MATKATINVTGVVQGVGFRPYIQRLARDLKLTGQVENREYGVRIEAFGSTKNLRLLTRRVLHEAPPGATVFAVDHSVHEEPGDPPAAFTIRASGKKGKISTFIPPDMSVCQSCLRELTDEGDRRYRYPFITCNDCGPRFTVIRSLPYDRPETVMNVFPPCLACQGEYRTLENRRCHAQIISCPQDGPLLTFMQGHEREEVGNENALRAAIDCLKEGGIVALKGIGGFHLACAAEEEDSVLALRRLKNRPAKPLALMARDLATIGKYASFNDEEADLLSGWAKPIVVLKKKDPTILPHIAPGLHTLGFMLPYSPLHHLILHELPLLVMTSGNIEGEVIAKDNEEARAQLAGVTPYFLVHDRDIINRCDDSLVRVMDREPVLLRRSRGYVPLPIGIKMGRGCRPTLATGGDLKACFGLSKDGFVWLSQYLGDLERQSNHESYLESLAWFARAFEIEPERVVTDAHPRYFSRSIGEEYAARRDLPCLHLQHHRAHVYSVMAEHGLTGAIGVAFDGTGYGDDGQVWGGEFFLLRTGREERLAHLDYVPLPGGDKAIAEPTRMALSYLHKIYGEEGLRHLPRGLATEEDEALIQLLSHGRDLVQTSSMGRLFDAVSALLGICRRQRYDGEAACLLEAAATPGPTARYPWSHKTNVLPWVIRVDDMLAEIVGDLEKGRRVSEIAWRFHTTIAEIVVTIVKSVGERFGERTVCLSGGVFQNAILFALTRQELSAAGFRPFFNRQVPANDGGIALGQIYGLLRREGA